MKSLDCNQIKIYINLEIIGEENKYKKNYIYFLRILKKFMQFSVATWRNHGFQAQLLLYNI